MNLSSLATIVECERHLLKLRRSGDDVVRMPTQVRGATLGGEATLTQLVMSWVQATGVPHLSTFAKDGGDKQIEKLVRRLHGLAAALCVVRASGISGDILAPLRDAALTHLAELQGSAPAEHSRGQAVDIVCADHLARGAPATLYATGEDGVADIRSRIEYRVLAEKLLGATVRGSYQKHLDREMAEAIGSLLYEIFRNTEDHALTDISGNVLERSIRAVRINHLSPLEATLSVMAQEFPALAAFCERQRPAPGAKQIHLLELSVLDSGPGYAPRLTKHPLTAMSLAEESEAVHRCFSAATSKARSGFGQGLPHVIRVLRRKGGFLRLRTGRLSLFADLGSAESAMREELRLDQWQLPNEKELAAVSGALLTIFIPLVRDP
jgi:hypothetical protein